MKFHFYAIEYYYSFDSPPQQLQYVKTILILSIPSLQTQVMD